MKNQHGNGMFLFSINLCFLYPEAKIWTYFLDNVLLWVRIKQNFEVLKSFQKMKHFCTHTFKLCSYCIYTSFIYIYIFWFNRLKFRFWIFENYEKKSACFLSSSQELAGVPLSLCVSYSTVNHSLLVPWGRNKRSSAPIHTYTAPTQSVSWNCT